MAESDSVSPPDTRAVLDRRPNQCDRLSPTIDEPFRIPAGCAEVRLVIKIGTMFARGSSARPSRVYVAVSTSRKGMTWQPKGDT